MVQREIRMRNVTLVRWLVAGLALLRNNGLIETDGERLRASELFR